VDVEQRVQLRMQRQEIFDRPAPPHLWVVIDEAALRRPIGSASVMRAQLRDLLEMADLGNVTIQVHPLRARGHAAGGGGFTLLRFPADGLADTVYLEQLNSAVYRSGSDDVDRYLAVLHRLVTQAETPAASVTIIDSILDQT
jgi:hypothetical protein